MRKLLTTILRFLGLRRRHDPASPAFVPTEPTERERLTKLLEAADKAYKYNMGCNMQASAAEAFRHRAAIAAAINALPAEPEPIVQRAADSEVLEAVPVTAHQPSTQRIPTGGEVARPQPFDPAGVRAWEYIYVETLNPGAGEISRWKQLFVPGAVPIFTTQHTPNTGFGSADIGADALKRVKWAEGNTDKRYTELPADQARTLYEEWIKTKLNGS